MRPVHRKVRFVGIGASPSAGSVGEWAATRHVNVRSFLPYSMRGWGSKAAVAIEHENLWMGAETPSVCSSLAHWAAEEGSPLHRVGGSHRDGGNMDETFAIGARVKAIRFEHNGHYRLAPAIHGSARFERSGAPFVNGSANDPHCEWQGDRG